TTPSITISQADTTTSGYLTSTDWNTFNNKASTASLNNYVLKAGDTMTGALALPSNGLTVGTTELVVSGGKLGIGLASPNYLLESRSSVLTNNTEVITGAFTGPGLKGVLSGYATDGAGAIREARVRAAGSIPLALGTTNSNNAIYILDNGNVGLGLTNPGQKLEVVGNVKATQLCIGSDCRAAWPTGAGGTVTSVTSANTDISVATTTTTPVLTLNSGTGANQILKLNGSSEIPAVSGVNLTNLDASNLASGTLPTARLPAFTGDVTSSAGSNTLTLGTVPVSKGGTGVTSFGANKLVSTNGTGTALASWSCPVGQLIKFDGSGVIGCDTIAGILGYTPANGTNYVAKTGDTMSGTLNLASNGLVVGTNQLVVSGGNTGVGTASPIGALQIHQTSSGAPAIIEGTNPRLALVDTAVSPNTVSGSPAWILDSASDVFRVYRQPNVTSSGVVYLQVDNTGVTNFPGGNVGVGVSSPTERFEVAGKVKATELCIGADCRAAWPAGAGGSVTSVTSANGDITVATTTTTPVLTLNTGTGANQIVKLNASSQLPAVSGANLTNLNAGNISSGTLPVARGGTGATSFSANRLVASDGSGNLASWSCTTGQVPKFDGAGVVGCDTIANILGYTPANGTNYVAKAGDTMSGTLNLPSNGLVVGATQLVATGSRVGIGTASPSELLHVNGASTFNGAMDFRMGGVSNNAWIGASTNVWTDPHLHIGGYGASPNRKIGLWADTLFASGNVGIGNTAPVVSLDMSTRTDAIALPKGTNAQQPGSPAAGWMRYNTDKSSMEVYDGAGWKSISMSTASSPAFYVHKNGVDQTVASSTYVKLTFGTKLFDQTNAWSSDRFTPTVAGRYTFSLNVYCPNASTHCHPLIYKNGSPYAGNVGAGSGNVGNSVSAIVDMNGTTDYVEAYVYDYGTTIHGAQQWTNFSGALLAGNTTASSGSGSANTLAKWSNATTLTSSIISESSGNVGIGTGSPATSLHVESANPIVNLKSTSGSGTSAGFYAEANGRKWSVQNRSDLSGGFSIADETASSNRLVINSAGNVGIGTTGPTTKLEVAGTVKATQVESSKAAFVRVLLAHCSGGCASYHGLNVWTNTAGYTHSVLNNDTATFTTSNGNVTINKAGTYRIKIFSMIIPTSGAANQYGCPFINGSPSCSASASEYVPHKQAPAGSWSSGVHEFIMDIAAGTVVGYGYYTNAALDYWAHDGYTGMLIHKLN
ncbi:MAG: hypothetical protein KF681_17390, partial [Bdellovibrionaceae bacterium]|nr:hypothetical protein [Pseudobdellovibrionaceae bacterium]